MEHNMRMKSSKGYPLDDDEQERLSSLPGVTVYTLESALTEAIYPVFEYFLGESHCAKCSALAVEREVMEALLGSVRGFAVDVPPFCEDHKC